MHRSRGEMEQGRKYWRGWVEGRQSEFRIPNSEFDCSPAGRFTTKTPKTPRESFVITMSGAIEPVDSFSSLPSHCEKPGRKRDNCLCESFAVSLPLSPALHPFLRRRSREAISSCHPERATCAGVAEGEAASEPAEESGRVAGIPNSQFLIPNS